MNTRSWLPNYSRAVTRRAFLRATAAGAGAATLIACGGDDEGGGGFAFQDADSVRAPGKVWRSEDSWTLADETDAAVPGGVYPGALDTAQDEHWDPITVSSSNYRRHIYEQLMQRNARPGIDPRSKEGQYAVGGLAQSWEFSNDGLTVTFTLRPNVRFQNIAPVNGRVMDMDDWRTSTERNAKEGTYRSFFNDVIDNVTYPDATHMVFKFKAPYAPLNEVFPLVTWGWPIMPKELNANTDLAKQVAIGTGFKQLDKFQPSITHEYKKVKEYWGGEPFIDRWHFPLIPEYSNRYAQFTQGRIIRFTPTARDVLTVAKDVPGAVVIADPPDQLRASRYLFGLNRPNPDPYNDPRVRIALRRSIDFKSIGEVLSNRIAFEAAGIPVELKTMTHMPQNPSYWLDPEKGELGKVSESYLYSVAAAKQLMSAAGHTSPLPIRVAVELSRGSLLEEDVLRMDSLKAAGTFAVDVLQVPTAQEQRKYRVDRDWEGIAWSNGTDSEADYLIQRDWIGTAQTNNRTTFAHPRTEELFVAQRREVDFNKRVEILKDVQRWAAEHMMVVPAQHMFSTFSFQWPWIHNYNWGTPDTYGTSYFGSHKQWLAKEMPSRNG